MPSQQFESMMEDFKSRGMILCPLCKGAKSFLVGASYEVCEKCRGEGGIVPPKLKKIYLAGPMLNCSVVEIASWRDLVKKQLEGLYEFLDPFEFEADETKKENWPALVEGDLEKGVRACDILFAHCWKASPGTAMEICYAFIENKLVYTINSIQSPWIEYHSSRTFNILQAGIDHLKELAK
jgi:nucleoside 2-deoxyribosyltransferase